MFRERGDIPFSRALERASRRGGRSHRGDDGVPSTTAAAITTITQPDTNGHATSRIIWLEEFEQGAAMLRWDRDQARGSFFDDPLSIRAFVKVPSTMRVARARHPCTERAEISGEAMTRMPPPRELRR